MTVRQPATPRSLRFISYLAPGLPEGLFRVVAGAVSETLGMTSSLEFDATASGPSAADNPFSQERCDVGFMCSPALLWLRDGARSAVELAGAGMVFADVRAEGRPVYFCDVVVRRDSPFQAFADLHGRVWAYNDASALSGYFAPLLELRRQGKDLSFFGRLVGTGSHFNSLDAVGAGQADAASIDSNVLSLRLRDRPHLRDLLRVIAAWGPYPTSPVVLRANLPTELKANITSALLTLHHHEAAREALARYGLLRFAPVPPDFYDAELASLALALKEVRPRGLEPPLPAPEAGALSD